jgi:uncharacterized protein (DUF1778 family)
VTDLFGYTNGMARPPKDPSEIKSVDIRVPLTVDQKKLIFRAAAVDGTDVATWLRPILIQAAHQKLNSRQRSK